MMKKILCLLIAVIFLSASIINAQSIKNRTNFWHFNFNCAIDFNSGSPVSLNNSALYNYEGTTSISDSNGNLLFYNGGGNIYNKNNQVMVNGSGLTQGNSASQACLAVPLPGTDSIWYLFTVADGGSQNKYSIIDMSLQSGLGEVTQKNLNVFNSGEEKITGCLHANGIATNPYFGNGCLYGGGVYYCYKYDINTLETVPPGQPYAGQFYSIGDGTNFGSPWYNCPYNGTNYTHIWRNNAPITTCNSYACDLF